MRTQDDVALFLWFTGLALVMVMVFGMLSNACSETSQSSQPYRPPVPSHSVVFIESPYSGDIDRNIRYLLLCNIDAFARGEMPCSSHGVMTQHPAKLDFYVSDYESRWDVFTRDEAIERAHTLRHVCSKVVFYTDKGMSSGMKTGLEYCQIHQIPYEMRSVDPDLVLGMNAPLIPCELVEAILSKDQDYSRFFEGTPLLELPEVEE